MARALSRTLTTAALSLGLAVPLVTAGGTALADPKNAERILLDCSGTTYHVAVFGNGEFTPALDMGSNKVFIPHAFTGFTGYLYDASNVLVESWNEPDSVQGKGQQPRDLTCTYTVTFTFDGSDPEAPPAGSRFVGIGQVHGQLAH